MDRPNRPREPELTAAEFLKLVLSRRRDGLGCRYGLKFSRVKSNVRMLARRPKHEIIIKLIAQK